MAVQRQANFFNALVSRAIPHGCVFMPRLDPFEVYNDFDFHTRHYFSKENVLLMVTFIILYLHISNPDDLYWQMCGMDLVLQILV